MSGVWWTCLVLATLLHAGQAQKTFLGRELPLNVTVSTPYELSDGSTSTLPVSGRQAITAVFSRPVIALGSDFGDSALPASLVPFQLSCGDLGRLRWVTTSIARWDPRIEWPTDLDCSFSWNRNLRTFDGAPLVLPDPATVTLTTPAVQMNLVGVSSARANDLTDNQWDAYAGLSPSEAPEVPPDGNITLSFSYPIQLDRLAAALKLQGASNQNLSVLPCLPPTAILPLAGSGAARAVRRVPLNCVLVQIRPGLPAGAKATLTLPAGSIYNEVAGPTKKALDIQVVGLRAFKIPLRTDFQNQSNPTNPPIYDGVKFRRVTLWLPHGLADNTTTLQALSRQITICPIRNSVGFAISPCRPMGFELKRPTRGTVVMNVPGIQPLTQYRVTITANEDVKDGYGLPLKSSSAQFWVTAFDSGFQGPSLSGSVALLEEDAGELVWPYVGRGNTGLVRDAAVFPLSTSAAKFLTAVQLNNFVDQVPIGDIGTPARRITRPLDSNPTFQNLTLGSTNTLNLVTTCCGSAGYPRTGPAFASATIVARSNLQLVVFTAEDEWTAWVTSTVTGQAVEGADVQLYTAQYGKTVADVQDTMKCTSDASGKCTISSSAVPTSNEYRRWAAVVTADGFGPLYIPDVAQFSRNSRWQDGTLVGKLVLDRKLVKPGQKLYVKAYVLQQSGSSLVLPAGQPEASWQITPNFDATNSTPWSIPATVNTQFGTASTVIDVPEEARLVDYYVQLIVGSGSRVSSASEGFTVADPRPPTAMLGIVAPTWVKPKDDVKVRLNITSYLGQSLGNANVQFTWNTDKANGNQTVTTNSDGEAEAVVPLGRLPEANVSLPGQTLNLRATWVGNTGELITTTKTVKIEEGPIRVDLARTLVTDLPGMPFGVMATTTSNEDDKPITGVDVTVTLVPVNASTLPSGCGGAAAAVKCVIKSGVSNAAACQIALPCAAEFRVKGCVPAGSGQSCSSQLLAGRNSSYWQDSPWSSQPAPTVLTTQRMYAVGDTPQLQLQNSYYGAASALVIWGNALQRKTKLFPKLAAGANQLAIGPLGEECTGSCQALVMVSVARGTTRPATPGVRVSSLFDPLAPHTQSARVSLAIKPPTGLNVTISGTQGAGRGGKLVVAPSASSSITVKVVTADGQPASGAQVTLVGVDQALLDLLPYPLQDVNSVLQPSLDTSFMDQGFNGLRVLRSAINLVYSTLQRRLRLDPFLPLDTKVQPSGPIWGPRFWGIIGDPWSPPAAVDEPDSSYLARFSTPITALPASPVCRPGRPCPLPLVAPMLAMGTVKRANAGMIADSVASSMPAPAPAAANAKQSGAAESNSGAAASAAPVQGEPLDPTRSDKEFNTTPLWANLPTNADGTATFTFKAPVNLGSFVVRAYAVLPSTEQPAAGERQATYGGTESSLIVRRPLSLEAAIPRMVRVGDTFEAGVLLTGSLGDSPVTVTTRVTVSSAKNGTKAPVALTSSDTNSSSLSGDLQQQEVTFGFKATAIGQARLLFRVSSSAGGDALEVTLPVLGKQGPVFVATSFAIQATNGSLEGREEGLALPRATPGSGDVRLVAGVGNLPAIQATYAQLLNQEQDRTWPEATLSLALGLHPLLLSAYFPGRPSRDFAADDQLRVSTKGLSDVAGRLTTDQWGLVYTDPLRGPGWAPTVADIQLNAWGTWLVEGNKENTLTSNSAFSSALGAVQQSVPKWRSAISRQLVDFAQKARGAQPPSAYEDFDTMSWAYLVLGPAWVPEGVSDQIKQDLSLPRLIKASVNLTAGGQARVGLALLQKGAPSDAAKTVNATVKRLLSRVRVGGRTAYVADSPNGRSAAPLADQALVLALFQGTNTKNELVQKMSAYIAQGNPPSSRWPMLTISTGGWTAGVTSSVLQNYDEYTGSTKPNLQLSVVAANTVQTSTLLEASFTPSNSGTSFRAKPIGWGELPANATLQFTGRGKGQASVAASLTFTPLELLPFPTYRGLWVQRVMQLADNPRGSLGAVPHRSLVSTVVQVTTPDDMQQVVVEVMMPGGLEPLDPRLYSDPQAATICRSGEDETDITAPGGGISIGGPVGIMPRMIGPSSDMAMSIGVAPPRMSWGGMRIWPPLWPMCPAQETAPSEVTFTFSFMRAGTHTIRFGSVAATRGTFVLPPVKAYVTQQPEIMGLSAAGSFKVCAANAPCDGKLPAIAAPKACPADCNDNGSCNLSTGKCLCAAGFSGEDCSAYSGIAVV